MKQIYRLEMIILLSLLFLLALISSSHPSQRNNDGWIAPLVIPSKNTAANSIPLPNRFIVHLRRPSEDSRCSDHLEYSYSRVDDSLVGILEAHRKMLVAELSTPSTNSSLDHIFDFGNFIGYSGEFDSGFLDKIRRDPAVELVEQDQIIWAGHLQLDSESIRSLVHMFKKKTLMKKRELELVFGTHAASKHPLPANVFEQRNAPWGLSKISSHASFGEETGDNQTYSYPKSAGSNVDVYIVDTGINIDHEDFDGRAVWGTTIPQFDTDVDGNGHGTHVAGTVGGKTFGIAKNASLIAVKVLRTNGFGTNSDVIKGIEWVLDQHDRAQAQRRRSVVNMSLGGGKSLALERAIESCIREGIHFSVAAGNENADACSFSPAGSKNSITVGASTLADKMAYFSNIGPCVDIFAPGVDIISTWIGTTSATHTLSGTSMACPHVAGVLALYLGEKDYSPKELKEIILEAAASNALEDIPTHTPNKLVSTRSLLRSIVATRSSMHTAFAGLSGFAT